MGKYDKVFQRDGYKCRHCRSRNGLHPHHVIYRSHGGHDTGNNILTLCFICHKAHHDGFLAIDTLELLENDLVVKFTRLRGWKP